MAYNLFTNINVELTINFICTYLESSPLLPSLLIHYCREKNQSTLYEALCRDITATSALTTVWSSILNLILQQICLIWKHSLYDLDFITSFLCNVTSSLVIPVLSWNIFLSSLNLNILAFLQQDNSVSLRPKEL